MVVGHGRGQRDGEPGAESVMSIRVVIFDLGGVLVKVEPEPIIRRLIQETGRPRQEVEQVICDEALHEAFELGRMSARRFFQEIQGKLGLGWSYEEFVAAWNGMLAENTRVTDLLERLQPHYTLVVLTNTNILHDEHIRRHWPVFQRIQHWVASYQVGCRKPEAEIYQEALRLAGVRPEAAVYIDDRQAFVDAARRLGLRGIHCIDGVALEEELQMWGVHV